MLKQRKKISREKSEGENKQTNRGEKQLKAIRKRKKLIWRVNEKDIESNKKEKKNWFGFRNYSPAQS
jgi:hypothetical protein